MVHKISASAQPPRCAGSQKASQVNCSTKTKPFSLVEHQATPPSYTGAAIEPAIELRPYQQRMVAETYQHLKQGRNRVLLTVIMGAGKTITSAWMMRDAVSRGHQCVFLVSLNVLLEQTAATLRSLGVSVTILQGDRPVDPTASVIAASCQTLQARRRRGKAWESLLGTAPRLIFADEAHNTAFLAVYEAIEQHYLPQGTSFIGLTATPWRLSRKEWLGQRFDVLVEGQQPPDIIKMGGAVPCRGYSLAGALDLETLRVRAGEYIDSEIASQATRPEALEHVVREWQRVCSGRPTLMVGATVRQAQATLTEFVAQGIAAELIVGDTPQAERLAIFDRVTRGETRIICSVGCLNAGFNQPCISAVLYVRATKSKALFHQTAGRGSRPHAGKGDYLLLDFGGNLKRHGNPMGWQVYDIGPKEQIDTDVSTKTCEDCGAEVNVFARVCPECGAEFGGDRVEEEQDLVLAELNEYVDRFTKEKIKNLRQWRAAAFEAGRSPDEPIDRFVAAYGHTPPAEWLLYAALRRRNSSQKRKVEFLTWLTEQSQGGRWAEQWITYHLRLEFGQGDIEALGIYQCWDEVLGVPYSANWEAIKAGYRERIRDLPDGHPDHELLALAIDDARADITEAQAVEVSA